MKRTLKVQLFKIEISRSILTPPKRMTTFPLGSKNGAPAKQVGGFVTISCSFFQELLFWNVRQFRYPAIWFGGLQHIFPIMYVSIFLCPACPGERRRVVKNGRRYYWGRKLKEFSKLRGGIKIPQNMWTSLLHNLFIFQCAMWRVAKNRRSN